MNEERALRLIRLAALLIEFSLLVGAYIDIATGLFMSAIAKAVLAIAMHLWIGPPSIIDKKEGE